MDLTEYLKRNDLSLGQLAKRCGTSASTILRMKEATVAPSRRVAVALWTETDGQVTPNDLFGLHYAPGHCCCNQCIGHFPSLTTCPHKTEDKHDP